MELFTFIKYPKRGIRREKVNFFSPLFGSTSTKKHVFLSNSSLPFNVFINISGIIYVSKFSLGNTVPYHVRIYFNVPLAFELRMEQLAKRRGRTWHARQIREWRLDGAIHPTIDRAFHSRNAIANCDVIERVGARVTFDIIACDFRGEMTAFH